MVLGRVANLVTARTRLEAFVGEVELFDTQRAGLLFVIVEYQRVLLHAFGHGGCGVTRAEGSGSVVWIATGGEVQRDGARGGGWRAGGGMGGEESKSRNAGR